MDLRQYFRKLREAQTTISEPETFVTSLETEDGGRAGVITEVSRELAAKMIVEGRATLSTKAERDRFVAHQNAARAAARTAEIAQKLQVTVVSPPEPQRRSSSTGAEDSSRK